MDKDDYKRHCQKYYQKQYRDRESKKEANSKADFQKLRAKIDRSVAHIPLLIHNRLLDTSRCVAIRRSILQLYTDYFEYGVDRKQQVMYQKQEAFLSFNVAIDCLMGSPTNPRGYKGMLDNWEMYSTLDPRLNIHFESLEMADPEGDVFLLNLRIT